MPAQGMASLDSTGYSWPRLRRRKPPHRAEVRSTIQRCGGIANVSERLF